MLSRRLRPLLAASIAVGLLGACDQPIKDNVVVPGITAMNQAEAETCDVNASMLRQAIEIYEIRNGEPPPDEAALVPDYIRDETPDWNIVDGRLVAENPACGPVGDDAPTPTQVDIQTDAVIDPGADGDVARTADDYLADLSAPQIDRLGGSACATELAEIFAGVDRYVAELERAPGSFADVVAAGLLDPPELWEFSGGELAPVQGSGCVHPDDALADP